MELRRVPVVDSRGKPCMPCTPPKARILLKNGEAKGRRNKLGIFYIQLTYELEPNNQPLVVGVDPGSKFEGYSVVGTKDTVLNIMAEAPTHIKTAVATRRQLRRARRYRKWCRPCRSDNRNKRKIRLPPSTRSRWEAKARIIHHLISILPITKAVVEDVKAEPKPGKDRKWNQAFSPVQVGKNHLYNLLKLRGLDLCLYEGWQTKELREKYGLKKTSQKAKKSFESHSIDAWVMAASYSGAKSPTCKTLYYVTRIILYRRQLHFLQFAKGGKRKPYGGTRSMGLKRGTLVKHPKYGLVSVGGQDIQTGRVSLHRYNTNQRLCQNAKSKNCHVVTWTPYRSIYLKQKQKAEFSNINS